MTIPGLSAANTIKIFQTSISMKAGADSERTAPFFNWQRAIGKGQLKVVKKIQHFFNVIL